MSILGPREFASSTVTNSREPHDSFTTSRDTFESNAEALDSFEPCQQLSALTGIGDVAINERSSQRLIERREAHQFGSCDRPVSKRIRDDAWQPSVSLVPRAATLEDRQDAILLRLDAHHALEQLALGNVGAFSTAQPVH
jgi:hypothetical protein